MLTNKDTEQIKAHGVSENDVEKQLGFFQNGFPPSKLIAPALPGSGMSKLSDDEIDRAVSFYDEKKSEKEIIKFVPASGAATRMFKSLFAYLDSGKPGDVSNKGSVAYFLDQVRNFAFYKELNEVASKSGGSIEDKISQSAGEEIVDLLLSDKGLSYGVLPKGLLSFHQYDSSSRTPVEEHLVEGCEYAATKNGVQIHLTVSPEHQSRFESHVSDVRAKYEEKYGVKIKVTYSQQKPSTDTIAVDLNNEPFRNSDGGLLFRPAGHGALLSNLNDLDADLVFIKNIDNVVPDRLKSETIRFKKVIAGLLLETQEKVFAFLNALDQGSAKISEIKEFISAELGYKVQGDLTEEGARQILNRPMRVCGMVKSEGDPGGGPFWVEDNRGTSLQIVETAQIDLGDTKQSEVFHQATHFNPADLACGLKNYKGEKFDLLKFRDPLTGFVTQKSKDGKDLKAQELPGLWNGSMADWNTIFVEVPIITFNPVKSVNDLLGSAHQ